MINWTLLPAEIHNKIYDMVDIMNAFDVAEHNRKTVDINNQFLTCAQYIRGFEGVVRPSLVATCRPTNCLRCMNSVTLCLECEEQAQRGWGWNDWEW